MPELAQRLGLRGGGPLGEPAQPRVEPRQFGVAQVDVGREALGAAAHDVGSLIGLDLAHRRDGEAVERPRGAERVGDVAEGVLPDAERAVDVGVDPHPRDVLPLVRPRRQPEQHGEVARRRREAEADVVADPEMHGPA